MKVCAKIKPSLFDKRIAIQAITRTSDNQGGYTEAWATSNTMWASIKPVSANEKIQAMQLETPITHRVVIRYIAGITTANRILYGARVFHIVEAINNEEANVFLTMKCIEIEG